MKEFGLSHRSFAHHATTVGGWLRSRVSSLSRVLGITIVKHSFTWINITPGYQPSQSGRDQGDSASVQHLNQATVAQISQGIERVHNGCTRCRHAAGSLTLLGIPGKTCRRLGRLPRTDDQARKKRQVMADTRDTLHASRRARANGDHRPGCERRAPSRQPSYTRHQTRQAERRAFTATRLKYCRSTVGILSRIDRQATEHRGLAQGTHAAQKQSNVLSHNPAHFTDK